MSAQPSATLDVPFPMIAQGRIGSVLVQTVDGRDLHRFLEVGRDFSNWIKGRIDQYGFAEGVDYVTFEDLSSPDLASAKARPQKTKEYALTLDMGKELGMVENNDRGRQVRRYFIEQEKVAKQNPPRLPTTAEAFANAFQMLADQERRQTEQADQLKALDARVEEFTKARVILDKMPVDCESIVYIRKRINKQFGLSEAVVDKIVRDSPFSLTIRALVRNPHVDAEGSHFAGYAKKDVSTTFKRFVGECQMVSATMATHSFIEGRFKLIRQEQDA